MESVKAVRVLLESLIDYAGLFPPSSLPMIEAVQNYRRYSESPELWMSGPFIVPASRLDEFESFADPGTRVTALAGNDFESDLARILRSPLLISSVETKASSAAQIESAMKSAPAGLIVFFELTDLDLVPLIGSLNARAKIRTGGITPEATPPPSFVARFLQTCARYRVPFKATAGLHHPLRFYAPLTYDEGAPSGWMFGFLNVFLAAALARRNTPADLIEKLLIEESPAAFRFERGAIEWSGCSITSEEIASMRRKFAISFGSCSFEEPVAGLKAIGLI